MIAARRLAFVLLAVGHTACGEGVVPTRDATPAILLDALDDVPADEEARAPMLGLGDPVAIEGRYIVVLDKGADDDDLDALVGAGPMSLADASVHYVYRSALKGFAAQLSVADVDALRSDPRVAYVEADRQVHATVSWGLDRLDQDDLPLDGSYDTGGLDGAGVHAYIVDTGIRGTHVAFAGRLGGGHSVIAGGTEDCDGHGTHVAGTVGGTTHGVARGVTLHAVRVLDCEGNGTMSGVAAGLDWIRANAVGRAVVNMSLTGPGSWTTDYAVGRLEAAGITVVVAAGNDNADACGLSPARAETAITVGATRYNDQRWSLSNFGSCVDLFAPGAAIKSSYVYSDSSVATLSGTSMASPHVAGVVALYLQANPDATPAQVRADLVAVAVAGKVGDPMGSPNFLLSSSVPAGTPEPEDPSACPGCPSHAGTLTQAGDLDWQPDGTYLQLHAAQTIVGALTGPSNADFDLALYHWTGEWSRVAASESASSVETIEYAAAPGYYIWRIRSYAGSGPYTFAMSEP